MKNLITVLGISFLILVSFLLPGCASRYRVSLYMSEQSGRYKMKVGSEFVPNTRLNDPLAHDPVIPGDGNTLLLKISTRIKEYEENRTSALQYDEYFKCRFYLQLGSQVSEGTIELKGNSFVRLLGRYNLAATDKIYFPREGGVTIDSLSGNSMFGTIVGEYVSRIADTLRFDGQFRAKYK